jgi:molybdopterin converting factor small subunit
MVKIKIELWLWLGKELNEDFKSLTDMKSELEIKLEENTTIGKLFDQLAERYRVIGERVFNGEKQMFYENIVVNVNEKVTNPHKVYDTRLKEADKITILPVYTGG